MLWWLEILALINWVVGVLILLRLQQKTPPEVYGLWPYILNWLAIMFWPIWAVIFILVKLAQRSRR